MLLIAFVLVFLSNVFFVYKYLLLKKSIKDFKSIGTGRIGFYQCKIYMQDANVFVKEVDRYTNGYSKIIIDYIESNSSYKDWYIQSQSSLRLTSEIEWLEGEEQVRQLRKYKLKQLEKI